MSAWPGTTPGTTRAAARTTPTASRGRRRRVLRDGERRRRPVVPAQRPRLQRPVQHGRDRRQRRVRLRRLLGARVREGDPVRDLGRQQLHPRRESRPPGARPGARRQVDRSKIRWSVKPLVPFAATEDTPFSGPVATFVPGVTGLPATAFSATIDWGDSAQTSRPGSIVIAGTACTRSSSGAHTYIEGGTLSGRGHRHPGSAAARPRQRGRQTVQVAGAAVQRPAARRSS